MEKKLVTSILTFNSLPNDNILDQPKLKVFADDNLNVAKMISLYHIVENLVGKRRKCWSPTMFSKGFFHSVVKTQDCVVKS